MPILNLREAILEKATARLDMGEEFPRWARVLRAVLFPIHELANLRGRARYWAIDSDQWIICGVRFTGRTMRQLAMANGELYRISVDEGTVRISATTIPVHAPDIGPQTIVDVEQIVYALQRAERRLQWQADQLHETGDYAAEMPAEDAQRMREAIAVLLARPTTANPTTPKA